MIRTPAVAGQFYPGTPNLLRETIAELSPAVQPPRINAIAAISPHAGYVYSGGVAAKTFAHLNIPDDVIVLGPNHHGRGESLAVMSGGQWEMPMGIVNINEQLAEKILEKSYIFKADINAHIPEHSLEVQIPFLQYHNPKISIVPICVSYISFEECRWAGEAIAAAIKEYDKPVLIVASTDMTHYESRASASAKDKSAMAQIDNLDPVGLYNTVIGNRISMCGIMPTTIALVAAKQLGAKQAERICYTDSGAVSGNTDQVVGYAGYTIF